MSIKKLFNNFKNAIMDPARDLKERLFLCLTLAVEMTLLIALIGDIVIYEYRIEVTVLIFTLIMIPVVTLICLYRNKLKIAVILIVIGLVFGLIPVMFFFGGGSKGGGLPWVIFAYMYAGMVLTGGLRGFIFVALAVITIFSYIIEFTHPELVYLHSRQMFFVDNSISVILIGIISFVMTWIQRRLFEEESRRAQKEAERAEELKRAQNRFFSSMSHEIRTPINSILGLNELILRDVDATEEIAAEAGGIQGAGKMLLALINDILDFSKMEAGSMDIVPVDYNVADMLSEIVNMIWLKADEKGLKMDVSIDPDVPSVLYGDEVRIKQVIINLLNNAVKYTREGTVSLRIENDELGEDFVILRISVTDTGMGIKKEALPHLFDAFKRVDQEKNRYIEGTGLGLSIVKQIAELMGGSVTVNSVYGEGSTFTVILKQGISDPTAIGELNIHNQHTVRASAYEASFIAPEAAILIVDDNEMNLEVESRLLEETGMMIDKAKSGKEALDMSLKHHYDVILMDHLMPEMDGIECLERIRSQQGGLNRTTPVVVLTANAGSENRELYNRSGFDGYAIKPVSGAVLEETLIKYISPEKIIMNKGMAGMNEEINASASYAGRVPVLITSTTMCDLPENIIKNLDIPILPFLVRTEDSVFKDSMQVEASELIRYMKQGHNAVSDVPDEAAYTEFFADNLKRAHHLIHISITASMSKDYANACEAAKSFENVTVINSECVSSSTGLLVLIAHKLTQLGMSVEEIVSELEEVKKRLKCSFVVDNTDFMVKHGLVSRRVNAITKALNMHLCLKFKEDRYKVGGIWLGSTKRAYRKYINKAIPVDVTPDSDLVFITYADVPNETLEMIKEEISRKAYFERVVFKQASAAISSNVGSGSFGILYFVKSNKNYNIGSYFGDPDERENESGLLYNPYDEREDTKTAADTDEAEEISDKIQVSEEIPADAPEDDGKLKQYSQLKGLDMACAIKNSGSEEAFKTVLKIFHESVPLKTSELEEYYTAEDWHNYTIKVHALKSSARLVGANGLADEAQLLENAGKEEDIDYIRNNHEALIQRYHKLDEEITPLFEEDTDGGALKDERPVADEFLMQSVYEGLYTAADSMSSDDIEEILGELTDYRLPDGDKEKIDIIKKKAEEYDYDGILELLK
ncbi:MAG: DegV family EDD domain-containing protein [Lachnospiraceae bacterium]|nr:DegV family EDD domain-containing protein [Lachnospiraceae bacterium]